MGLKGGGQAPLGVGRDPWAPISAMVAESKGDEHSLGPPLESPSVRLWPCLVGRGSQLAPRRGGIASTELRLSALSLGPSTGASGVEGWGEEQKSRIEKYGRVLSVAEGAAATLGTQREWGRLALGEPLLWVQLLGRRGRRR